VERPEELVEGPDQLAPSLDAASADWISALTSTGPAREAGLARLHELLVRVAAGELHRREVSSGISGPELDDLAHQAAADAMLAIIAKLDSFRGESRFTTWAYRFAVLEVSAKLGRHYWRRHPVGSLDAEDWERLPDRFGIDPGEHAAHGEMIAAIRRAVEQELTGRQRRLFVAVVLNGIPLDAVVIQTGMNRNSIYKAIFDARRKIRAFLVANGYLEQTRRGPR
jgi:RNA polymerase sigma-70 factor (ECF subfamily)